MAGADAYAGLAIASAAAGELASGRKALRCRVSITSLPAADQPAITQYAGQQLVNGDQAKAFADRYIKVHLSEVANGQTYSQVSAKAQADPQNEQLAGQVQTCSVVRPCAACC